MPYAAHKHIQHMLDKHIQHMRSTSLVQIPHRESICHMLHISISSTCWTSICLRMLLAYAGYAYVCCYVCCSAPHMLDKHIQHMRSTRLVQIPHRQSICCTKAYPDMLDMPCCNAFVHIWICIPHRESICCTKAYLWICFCCTKAYLDIQICWICHFA
jgi:hypothetical protein